MACEAVAQCNFTVETFSTTQQKDFRLLPLHIGEQVSIICEKDEWCYGRLSDGSRKCGIFPRAAVVPLSKANSPVTSEAQELISELTEVLNEWWNSIKETYGKQARMESQDEILIYMEDLMAMRKKILSGNVPVEELKEMRLQLARKIDLGNQWLGLDMVIRDEVGRVIGTDSASVVHAYRTHVLAADRILNDSKPNDVNIVSAFSLLVHAQSATVDCKSECEFCLSLYDATDRKFISENFMFYWSHKTGSLTNRNSKALFNDLGSKEFPSTSPSEKDHRILLCIRVARIAPIDPSSSTIKKQVDPGPPHLWSRQPYAAAVLELSELLNGPKERIIPLNREDSIDQLISKSGSARGSVTAKVTNGDGVSGFGSSQIMLSSEVLIGSLTHIKKANPHIFSLNPPVELRKMFFADVISADDIRNDLYVTLVEGDLHGGKGSDRNIEARVSLVDSNGVVKDSVEISTADGIQRKTTYHSLVFYHDERPKWNETVKIQIPEDTDQNMHLRITFYLKKCYDKTKQEKGPFALAFARIMDGATLIKDGSHELLVYKIENGKFDENDTSYSRLPATRNELKASQSQLRPQTTSFIYGEKNDVVIQTVTCSTTLTHDKNLLDILRWKSNRESPKKTLEKFSKLKGTLDQELVKFIPNFCDALFEIIDDHPDYDGLIFDALVSVIQLVNEERYKNFRPVLQEYIENFHSTVAFVKLIPVLQQRVESAKSTHERTLNTMKALGILMQMIVKSKQCSDRLGLTSTNFRLLMLNLLDSFVHFMKEGEGLMTCKNTALKYLPSIIPHLTAPNVFDPADLNDFLVRLLDNLGCDISTRCRLNFIKDIVLSDHFLFLSNRRKLLPKILDEVVDELENVDVEKWRSLERTKLEECMSACSSCADIAFDILERLFPSTGVEEERGTEEELYLIISKLLRTVMQTTVILINEKLSSMAFCALTIALLNKMSAQMYKTFVESHTTSIDKHDLLMEMVHLFRDLINKLSFPSSWFHMIFLQNKTILKTMKFVMSSMIDYFHAKLFDAELWQEYILTMVAFSTQKGLQINSPAISEKRSRLLSSQQDLRKVAAADLRSLWFQLSMSQKNGYIPSLIGSFLQVALIDDGDVRETIIPIFFDMLQCEFHSSPLKDFSKFKNEMIVQLDCLVDEDRGGMEFKEQLRRMMMDMCSSDSDLREEGCRFVETIDTLLHHLFEYREVRTSGLCIENGMSRTVELLNYYHEIEQPDLYINYVYKLYDLHMLSDNKVEAAFTLLKHAKMLSWADSELPLALLDAHLNRQCGTQRQLKEALYKEIAELFDEKKMWEEAVVIFNELVSEYDKNYEYEKLSKLLKNLAELYHKINTEGRVACTYYLVGFFGLGFPAYLNEKRFVYRGNESEGISSFQYRMLSTFPGSKLVNSMDDCSHLSKTPGKHIQIIPVQTNCEAKYDNKSMNSLIRWYYKNNRVQKFEYCRGEFRKGTKWTDLEESEITKSWVIRRSVEVKEPLPNILRWSLVVSQSDPIECSPLMTAIATMQKSNDEMKRMAEDVLSMQQMSAVPLGGAIRGIVQPFVQGGINNYDVFFTKECDAVLTPEERLLVDQLQELIRNQIPILEFCLYAHATREVGAQFHESLVDSFKDYKRRVEKRFRKIPSQLPPGCSIHLPSHQKSVEDRRSVNMDSVSSPSVMTIPNVFRRGGGIYTTKSSKTMPRKSPGLRAEMKNAIENGISKRISSLSDRSLDDMLITESAKSSLYPTGNSRLECRLRSPSLSPSCTVVEDGNRRSSPVFKRSVESPSVPPPLPVRRAPSPPNSQLLDEDGQAVSRRRSKLLNHSQAPSET